jgi:thymidylate kinase
MADGLDVKQENANALVVKVDGIDGCGKTTLLDQIASVYSGSRVLQMKEFGNVLDVPLTDFGPNRSVSELLRGLAMCAACDFDDIERELLWSVCSRRTNRLIIPRFLQSYDLILVDRSNLGNLAYGLTLNKQLAPVYQIVTTDQEFADLILWLDTPVSMCMSRLHTREQDLIEAKGVEFFEQVRHEYEKLALEPRVRRINGADRPDAILKQATFLIQEAAVRSGKKLGLPALLCEI